VARARGRPELHRSFVQWNYGPVDHEHHVQGSKEKRTIETPLRFDGRDRQGIDRAEILPWRTECLPRCVWPQRLGGHPPLLSPKGDHRSKIDGYN
jgi:hypothetical protein